jgi:ABC-2 type transport system ATP-binding protein
MTWGLSSVSVDHGDTVALADVSLELAPAAVTAVVGGDGAGKSTLLHCLAGLVAPSRGRVARPAKQRLGFMPATSGTWGDLTVVENVEFVASGYGMSSQAAAARRDALLERAGLSGATERLAQQLSGGMRQKLGFVLAILHEPELLLLDEPSTGVDPVSRVELWRLIAETAAGGTTVAMATTYFDEAERCSTVVVLDEGRVLACGSADRIVAQVPGSITATTDPSERARAWRRGRRYHEWHPDGRPGADAAEIDLEDAVIAFMLERRSRADAVGPSAS